jgi:radical SAM protein with 4Fe4S-binding SPASM domain
MKVQSIDEKAIYRTSRDICIKKIHNDRYAVWNRYIPSIIFLNKDCIKLLNFLKNNTQPYKKFIGFKRLLRILFKNNIIHEGNDDFLKENLLKNGEEFLKKINKSFCSIIEEKLHFVELSIINHRCNLRCPYCIIKYLKKQKKSVDNASKKTKMRKLLYLVEQFMCKSDKMKKPRRIHFNGGEILLEFEMIEAVVDYINKKYPKEKIDFSINTNATLIDEKIAKFLAQEKFKSIAISLDGYRENNEKTRKYADGRGTFDNIITSVGLINKYRSNPLNFFQGTLVHESEFDVNKVQEMKNYGFKNARLGVNVLDISKDDAEKMAELHLKMIIDSKDKDILIKDGYLDTFNFTVGNSKKSKMKNFSFFCSGLSNLPGRILYYNIDTEEINLLCGYCVDVQTQFDEIDGNIYHPLIFEKGINFLKKRWEAYKEICLDCELAGICKGGCVMTGLNSFNKKNEAACAFQKAAWKHFLNYISAQKER